MANDDTGIHVMTPTGVQTMFDGPWSKATLEKRQFRFIDQSVETVHVRYGDTLNIWKGYVIGGRLSFEDRPGYVKFLVSQYTPLRYDFVSCLTQRPDSEHTSLG